MLVVIIALPAYHLMSHSFLSGGHAMEFPGFDHLFSIHDPLGSRAFRGGWESDVDAFALLRGEIVPRKPVFIPRMMGSATPYDVIWTGMVVPIIVSQRVIDLLQAERLSGWQTYPVKVTGKNGEAIPGYYGLAIHGRCAPIDLSLSTIVLEDSAGSWHPAFLGQFFNPNSWDGSDIFMEQPDTCGNAGGQVYATFRVQQLFRKAKIGNTRFIRLDEERIATFIFTVGSKYCLPPDFRQRVIQAYRDADIRVPDKYLE